MKVRLLAAAAAALAALASVPAVAATEGVTGTVVRTLADGSESFGNCAVQLSQAPAHLGRLQCLGVV